MDFFKVISTSLLSVASLFLIAKIMGHKQIAQLDFFDYITGITIGSIAAELATELEKPWKPLISMIIYGIVAVSLSIISQKFPKTRKYINGTPTIVMDNGKLYRENMKKAKAEANEILTHAQKTATARSEEIIGQAQAQAAQIKEKASADIAQEKKKALNEAKDEISGIAVAIAEKVVERQLNEEDQEKLVNQFIENLGGAL